MFFINLLMSYVQGKLSKGSKKIYTSLVGMRPCAGDRNCSRKIQAVKEQVSQGVFYHDTEYQLFLI